MNVVLFGASGMIGSRILQELAQRGHAVTAVVRNPEKISAPAMKVVKGDVTNESSVASVARGADAVVSAFSPPADDPGALLPALRALLAGLTSADVKRVIVVGGAGSLEVAPGLQLVDSRISLKPGRELHAPIAISCRFSRPRAWTGPA